MRKRGLSESLLEDEEAGFNALVGDGVPHHASFASVDGVLPVSRARVARTFPEMYVLSDNGGTPVIRLNGSDDENP